MRVERLSARLLALEERLRRSDREAEKLRQELEALRSGLGELLRASSSPEPAAGGGAPVTEAAPTVEPEWEAVADTSPPLPERAPEASGVVDGAADESAAAADAADAAESELGPAPQVLAAEPPGRKEPKEAPALDLETRIGAVWFNRLGLIALVVGVVLLGRYVHPQLLAWHKVAAGYAASAALCAVGVLASRRLQLFARPVIAAGVALAFTTSCASYFWPPMRCLPLAASLLLMTLATALAFVLAERWRSQASAALGLLLGQVAAVAAGGASTDAAGADVFSLVVVSALSATAAVFVVRHHWLWLGLMAVLSAHLAHVLWALQEHPLSSMERRFWANFAALAAYYAAFLSSDLVLQHRLWRGIPVGAAKLSAFERGCGRAIGLAALCLHLAGAIGLFFLTEVYLDSIHVYLFAIGAVEAAVSAFHVRRGSTDAPFYGAMAVLLVTLGLFSWLSGLELNLALATEALVLLIAARTLRVGFLAYLAQAALAVCFVQFWFSPAARPESWPVFLGDAAVGVVFFAFARTEETWPAARAGLPEGGGGPESQAVGRRWSRLAAVFLSVAPYLAVLHVASGAVLLVACSRRFFSPDWELLACAVFASCLAAAAAGLSSRSFGWGLAVLEAIVPILLVWRLFEELGEVVFQASVGLTAPTVDPLLPVGLAAAAGLLASAWLLLDAGRRQRLRSLCVPAGVGVFSGFFTVLLSCDTASARPAWLWVPLVPALLLWSTGERWRRELSVLRSKAPGVADAVVVRQVLVALAVVAGSLLSLRAAMALLEPASGPLVFLTAVTILLLAWTLWRESPYLALGLWVHFAGSLCWTFPGHWDVNGIPWLHAGFFAAGFAAAHLLVAAALRLRRASLAWAGLAMLVVAITGAGLQFLIVRPKPLGVGLFAVWTLLAALSHATVETLRSRLRTGLGPAGSWRDSSSLAVVLAGSADGLAVSFAGLSLGLLLVITALHVDAAVNFAWFGAAYSVLYLVLAGSLRSAPLATCALLGVYAASAAAFDFLKLPAAFHEEPVLFASLLLVALANGGGLEAAAARCRGAWTARRLFFARLGIAAAYLLAFGRGGEFVGEWSGAVLGNPMLGFSAQGLVTALAVLTAARCGFGWLAAFGAGLGVWAGAGLLERGVHLRGSEADILVPAAVLVGFYVAAERAVAWRSPFGNSTPAQAGTLWLRRVLILLGAGVLLGAAALSPELRGYWTTAGWSVTALVFAGLGFLWRDPTYRRTGLGLFGLSLARLAIIDTAGLEPFYRILAYLSLGVCLLAVSFLYTRFREELKRWL
jgi:hypothetical protein